MIKKTYLRGDKIMNALEVTKKELFELVHKHEFISISKSDLNWLDTVNDSEIVGAIFGDIEAIDVNFINPDCWFVNREFINKNYKDLENSYLNFGEALVLLKKGYKVARVGWNGKGMFVFLVPGSRFKVNRPPLMGIYPEGTEIEYHAHIDMKTAQGYVVPWTISQTDALAEDWVLVKDN